jgi:hypothetical protein
MSNKLWPKNHVTAPGLIHRASEPTLSDPTVFTPYGTNPQPKYGGPTAAPTEDRTDQRHALVWSATPVPARNRRTMAIRPWSAKRATAPRVVPALAASVLVQIRG